MRPDQVRARVLEIIAANENRASPEAHLLRDELTMEVLTAIANGAKNPQLLAAEAIKMHDVKIPDWYEVMMMLSAMLARRRSLLTRMRVIFSKIAIHVRRNGATVLLPRQKIGLQNKKRTSIVRLR